MRTQPIQAIEVIEQSGFGVVLRVPEDANWTVIAAIANRAQLFQVELALPQRENLLPLLVAIANHAVEVHAQQVRQHLLHQCRETVDLVVSVMQVVNDADVRKFQLVDNRQLILGFAKPTAMVVQANLAPLPGSSFGNRSDARGSGHYAADVAQHR